MIAPRKLTAAQVRYLIDVVREHEAHEAGDALVAHLAAVEQEHAAEVVRWQENVEMVRGERDVERQLRLESEGQCHKAMDEFRAEVVEALKADLTRLNPSGQVAEDEQAVARHLYPACSPPCQIDSCRGCFPRAALSRLAAKAQGYEAAVADNAALLEEREELEDVLSPSVLIGYARNHPPQTRAESNMLRWPWETLDRVAAFFARMTEWGSHPGAALLEEHRKALVRARNEGLEKAAVTVEKYKAQPAKFRVAAAIRALKEPES